MHIPVEVVVVLGDWAVVVAIEWKMQSEINKRNFTFFWLDRQYILSQIQTDCHCVITRLCRPPDGRPSTHQGGMAVAAAWLPVCAEDLTRRQLLIPFWTNFRISKAIAANIIIDTENTKGFEPIWVFIFTGKFSRDCRSKGWYSLSSWIHLHWLKNCIS